MTPTRDERRHELGRGQPFSPQVAFAIDPPGNPGHYPSPDIPRSLTCASMRAVTQKTNFTEFSMILFPW
ncbi:hypothetical protein [Cystobacter fuscus]|uniref:hypothetical protein n=1 Tax=Cystobacter fuscus TaxID=43 RepID=UPI0018E05FBB|nr:hypothetical protein [Cystobacter fuscus]